MKKKFSYVIKWADEETMPNVSHDYMRARLIAKLFEWQQAEYEEQLRLKKSLNQT